MNHSSHISVAITAIVMALGIVASTGVNPFLMTTTTPAYAAPTKDKDIQREDGTSAFADWDFINVEVPGIGTVVLASVQVFKTETGIDVLVGFVTEEGNQVFGSTTVDESGFEIDEKGLTSATLLPVTMDATIYDEDFNPIGTTEVTFQATWEGDGELSTQKEKTNTVIPGFIKERFKGTFESRQATAEGTVNGIDLGTAFNAELRAFKSVQVTVINVNP